MKLRNKYFSYPVLSEDNDSYVDSFFKTDVDEETDGYNIKLFLKSELKNPELEGMLEKGEVAIIHHIECPQTCYRQIVKTKEYLVEKLIKDTEVNGIIQICSFLVANKDILKYTNSQFGSDYKGFKFDFEPGCILAVGTQINIRINKVKDDLANTSSIFSIIPVLDETVTAVSFSDGGDKIVISLPINTFRLYENTSSLIDIQPFMHSIIIIPALIFALTDLKENKDQLYLFEDRRWYRSLKKACNKIGVNIDEENLNNIDQFVLAQKLMDSPIPKAIDYVCSGEDINED